MSINLSLQPRQGTTAGRAVDSEEIHPSCLSATVILAATVAPVPSRATTIVQLLLGRTMNAERVSSVALASPSALLIITALHIITNSIQRLAWDPGTGATLLAHHRRFAASLHHLDVAILARGFHLHMNVRR
ncbi:unnamed protein product, partial [Heligmosomoides polygyrus]|uniref:Uncharacterized protein n=1 Tax=Heligmosomoides polygyrus TaxID=6339 RepID=A0A183FBE9_HELPZ